MPNRISAPIFTGEDVEELAAWILATMEADPTMAGQIGGGRLAAQRYARTRASQLLGMRLDRESNEWVPAARAPYRVGEDLRQKVQDLVTEAITRGDSVGTFNEALRPLFEAIPARSQMIAVTETANALNAGALSGYSELGVELVDVIDGPGCLPDGHDDDSKLPDPDIIGEIQFGRQANGQVWTVEQAAEWLIGHPNCKRQFSPRNATP